MRFGNPVLNEIAQAHSKTSAQVLLRWSIQHVRPSRSQDNLLSRTPGLTWTCTSQGFVPIPKSVSQNRIESNGDLFGFELSKEDMQKVTMVDLCVNGHSTLITSFASSWMGWTNTLLRIGTSSMWPSGSIRLLLLIYEYHTTSFHSEHTNAVVRETVRPPS